MRVLLDTNVLIWLLSKERPLSRAADACLADSRNILFVSVVSLWEIVLKHQTGKLWADANISRTLQIIETENSWTVLPVRTEHLSRLGRMTTYKQHKDPFDRLLIAQALHEELNILTADPHFARYKVHTIW